MTGETERELPMFERSTVLRLILVRGLPGSGKTTWAKKWVAVDVGARARVNKDALRAMLHDGVYDGRLTEDKVDAVRDAAIVRLLGMGVSVVSDDTNLDPVKATDLAHLGMRLGASVHDLDMTNVPLEECLARDAVRLDKHPIGAEAIRGMHERYLA